MSVIDEYQEIRADVDGLHGHAVIRKDSLKFFESQQ